MSCETFTGARLTDPWGRGRGWVPHRVEGDQSWWWTRGTHERRAKRGPWGSKLQGEFKAWGRGCGGGSGGSCFVWLGVHGVRVSRRQLVDGWLRWAAGGSRGDHLCFRNVGGNTRRRYRAGCVVPVACRVVFGTVGATCRRDNAAVEDWFEISPCGAGWVGAAVLCFSVRASAEGAYSGVLAARFDMAKSPAVITLVGGGRRIGSLDDVVATKDRNSGEVS